MTINRYCLSIDRDDPRIRNIDIDAWAEPENRQRLLSLLCDDWLTDGCEVVGCEEISGAVQWARGMAERDREIELSIDIEDVSNLTLRMFGVHPDDDDLFCMYHAEELLYIQYNISLFEMGEIIERLLPFVHEGYDLETDRNCRGFAEGEVFYVRQEEVE